MHLDQVVVRDLQHTAAEDHKHAEHSQESDHDQDCLHGITSDYRKRERRENLSPCAFWSISYNGIMFHNLATVESLCPKGFKATKKIVR